MRAISEGVLDISESLATFLLSSYINNVLGDNPRLEKRLGRVRTGRFSVADIYYYEKNTAIEVKSRAHGSSALKGVIQASVYKEQVDESIFCMQRPTRERLSDAIESFAESHGVGVVFIDAVPRICEDRIITRATGGCTKPFELWKRGNYMRTKINIIENSDSEYVTNYLETLEKVVEEKSHLIFDFAVEPDGDIDGFDMLYASD